MNDFEVGASVRAGRLAAAAAVLLALSTVILFASVPRGGRFVLVLAVIVVGGILFGSADRHGGRLAEVLGRGVVRGIGGGAVFLGCYLAGPLLVDMAARSESPPSPSQLILLTFLPPLVALTMLAAKRSRAASVGVGMVVSTVVLMLLVLGGVGPATTALSLLSLSIVAAVVAVSSTSALSVTASAAGAMAATAAVGAGVLPLAAFTGNDAVDIATAAYNPGMRVLIATAGLLLAALFGAVAWLRRDAAGGVIAGSALIIPPVAVFDPVASTPVAGFLVVPVLAGAVVVAGLTLPAARALADRVAGALRPGGATSARALLAAGGLAVLVFAAEPLPLLGFGKRVEGIVVLVLLVAVTGLAARLTGPSGALLAGATLIAWSAASPWFRLIVDTFGPEDGPYGRIELRTGIGLAVALLVCWVLIRAHRHPGVVAAAAYLLLGQLGNLVWTVTYDGETAAVWTMAVPLLLLGLPAAVIALLRRNAAAQAVAALTLAAGGFTLIKSMLQAYTGLDSALGLSVLTPSDVAVARYEPGPALAFAAAGLLVVALLAAQSTAGLPSSATLAAVLLTVVGGTQVVLAVVVKEGGIEAFDTLQWIALGVTAAVTAAAVAVTRATPSADTPAVVADQEEPA
ncbi:hypothetical protein [Alloactinosynnema sp. L-07]|uniref:hypothetical protein n=1 Tax=Alloactinosynnema sp. L-07 TaxID=1653480 RepID=UPI0006B5A97D|nr:hypothetical protein [Alloactinosynnema sp. L-07]